MVISIDEWFKYNYPKLFEYYKNIPKSGVYAFLRERGMPPNTNTNFKEEKKFIKDNEYLHDMWML